MNISIICNSYPTEKNPFNQIFIKKTHEEFLKKGIDVTLCYNKIFHVWGNANKVKNPFANILKYSVYICNLFIFWIRDLQKTDVLFPQGILIATFVSVLFKKLHGIPVVSYVHGGDLNLHYNKKGLMNLILRYSLDNSDHIVANSCDIYKKVKKVTHNPNVSIISPGIDLTVMKPLPDQQKEIRVKHNLPSNKLIFLAAGNSIKRKGFDVLLRALLCMDEAAKKNIYLVMLTEGPEKGNYIDFVEQNNLQQFVTIRDKVNHQILNEYYNVADVFIFPSREEPLGLVGLEAMASNTIVIGSDVGGIKEFVKHNQNGFLFKKENSDELAAIMEQVSENFSQLDHLYPEIQKTAKKHSLSKSADQLITLFKKIKMAS